MLSDLARLNDLSSFQSQMNQYILQRQQQAAGLGESMLAAGRGVSSQQTNAGPASGLMSGGNALSNLSTLMMLQNVLKGSGSGSVPGVPSDGGAAFFANNEN